MTREEIEREIADLQSYAQSKADTIERTLASYGRGVRPSWVSTDISIDQMRVDDALYRIVELKEKLKAENDQ